VNNDTWGEFCSADCALAWLTDIIATGKNIRLEEEINTRASKY